MIDFKDEITRCMVSQFSNAEEEITKMLAKQTEQVSQTSAELQIMLEIMGKLLPREIAFIEIVLANIKRQTFDEQMRQLQMLKESLPVSYRRKVMHFYSRDAASYKIFLHEAEEAYTQAKTLLELFK